ncbi:AAA family ATPase [Candidatus Bandiella numerosa]|uniref:AAA family ATPase n=1 Tax=Candidatus Bandiella numerosa TaxID=2570586 RepID=UPI001F2BCA57|nr:AAA family ATPase [Candidatus Bandiella numerosa]
MNRAQIIVIGGEKGGVGKSTIATNVAVELVSRGAKLMLIDSDPQKTSLNWVDRRNELNPTFSKIFGVSKEGNVREIIKELSTNYDIILLDASGRDSKSLRTALTICDKFYCPIKPSQADLETLPHVCELINVASDINDKLQSFAIISMASPNYKSNDHEEASHIINNLSDYLKLSKSIIMERKVYREALLQGKGITEMQNDKAISEIKNLVQEMINE